MTENTYGTHDDELGYETHKTIYSDVRHICFKFKT